MFIFLIIIINLMFLSCSSIDETKDLTDQQTTTNQQTTLTCPRGETNCSYPGKCPLYDDVNQNGFCDNGE